MFVIVLACIAVGIVVLVVVLVVVVVVVVFVSRSDVEHAVYSVTLLVISYY